MQSAHDLVTTITLLFGDPSSTDYQFFYEVVSLPFEVCCDRHVRRTEEVEKKNKEHLEKELKGEKSHVSSVLSPA